MQQARAHFEADLLEPVDLAEQVQRIDDDAVADVALDAGAHDARGDQLQRRLDAVDDQRVAGVVAALEADHGLGVVGQPVDDLALAFVAPLGADDDDIAAGLVGRVCLDRARGRARVHSGVLLAVGEERCAAEAVASAGGHGPAAVGGDETTRLARGHRGGAGELADDDLAARAQLPHRRAQHGGIVAATGRGSARASAAGADEHRQFLDVEAEADRRTVAAEDRADLVVAAAAHNRSRSRPWRRSRSARRCSRRSRSSRPDRSRRARADARGARVVAQAAQLGDRAGDAGAARQLARRLVEHGVVAVQARSAPQAVARGRGKGATEAGELGAVLGCQRRVHGVQPLARRPARRRARRARCARRPGRRSAASTAAACRQSSARSRISRSASRPAWP